MDIRVASRFTAAVAVAALAACGHDGPYHPSAPPTVGPWQTALPRRLTFATGLDGTPSVAGATLLYTRQGGNEIGAYTGVPREQCIAFMPLEGGTITRRLCPHERLPPDTLIDTWFEPALSPDGRRIAFMWQRGYRVSALAFLDAHLMVTPVDRPQDTTGIRHQVLYVEQVPQNPRRASVATSITWADSSRLLFLATYEHILKVKGGGAERVTDTFYDPLALQELDLTTGVARDIPGSDRVISYTAAPGGGFWVLKFPENALLLHLEPVTGAIDTVSAFPAPVIGLINVDGQAVAIRADSGAVVVLDPVSGTSREIGSFPGALHRLVPAGGRRFIVEVEDGFALFGSPPDLWLFALP